MENKVEPLKGDVLPEIGTQLIVINRDQDKWTNSFMVVPRHIDSRKPVGTIGTYHGWVPGAGGDLLWVEHGLEDIGAYSFTELAKVL